MSTQQYIFGIILPMDNTGIFILFDDGEDFYFAIVFH